MTSVHDCTPHRRGLFRHVRHDHAGGVALLGNNQCGERGIDSYDVQPPGRGSIKPCGPERYVPVLAP
jgi:hypothetical protein